MRIAAESCFRNASRNPAKRYPPSDDPRCRQDGLFPKLRPKFSIDLPSKVFTIGSCFARNIEEALLEYDIDMPTRKFAAPASEWPGRPNGLLNEYNPGSILQRVQSAIKGLEFSEDTIVPTGQGTVDLLLPGAGKPTTLERARQRREEIASVYQELCHCDCIIITLGLVEAWWDKTANCFLNQMPSIRLIKAFPHRFDFVRLGVPDVQMMLRTTVELLLSQGVNKILLTVSPVPLLATFTPTDGIIANSLSKSVLRVCADDLQQRYEQVDYFPSFEIVNSGGLASFEDDNRHVNNALVRQITHYMLESYLTPSSQSPG